MAYAFSKDSMSSKEIKKSLNIKHTLATLMSRKGQGISINVIVIASIALIVLVVLTVLFVGGMRNWWDTGVGDTVTDVTSCTSDTNEGVCLVTCGDDSSEASGLVGCPDDTVCCVPGSGGLLTGG